MFPLLPPWTPALSAARAALFPVGEASLHRSSSELILIIQFHRLARFELEPKHLRGS
jgi:hypothetical protein